MVCNCRRSYTFGCSNVESYQPPRYTEIRNCGSSCRIRKPKKDEQRIAKKVESLHSIRGRERVETCAIEFFEDLMTGGVKRRTTESSRWHIRQHTVDLISAKLFVVTIKNITESDELIAILSRSTRMRWKKLCTTT